MSSNQSVHCNVTQLVEQTFNDAKALMDRIALNESTSIGSYEQQQILPPKSRQHDGEVTVRRKKKNIDVSLGTPHKRGENLTPSPLMITASSSAKGAVSSRPPQNEGMINPNQKASNMLFVQNLENADGIVLCVDLNMKNVGTSKKHGAEAGCNCLKEDGAKKKKDRKVLMRVEMPNFEPTRVTINGKTFERID